MRWQKITLQLLYAAAAIAFVALIYSNWRLRREYDATQAQLAALSERAIVPFRSGDVVPQLDLVDRSGRPVRITPLDWKNTSYVALVLPGCAPCHEQIAAAKDGKLRNVVLISLVRREAAARDLEEVSGNLTLYFATPETVARLRHRLDGVPQVLRVAAGGKITATCHTMAACGGAACKSCDLPST
jgi:hypothetical protein